MSTETGLRPEILVLAERIDDLHHRAHAEYAAVVEDILRSECHETRHIEHTLDGLLDFCGNAAVLQLYRRLCRYYFSFDSIAAIGYVNSYRKMYTGDDTTGAA